MDGECYDDAGDLTRNTCATGFDIDETALEEGPMIMEGDTYFATDDFHANADECAGMPTPEGDGPNDHVYILQPTVSGLYNIQAEGYDLALYVLGTCDDPSSCIVGSEDYAITPEAVSFSATSSNTYYIVVDGYGVDPDLTGSYTLTIVGP
jgi:hypothetical protein